MSDEEDIETNQTTADPHCNSQNDTFNTVTGRRPRVLVHRPSQAQYPVHMQSCVGDSEATLAAKDDLRYPHGMWLQQQQHTAAAAAAAAATSHIQPQPAQPQSCQGPAASSQGPPAEPSHTHATKKGHTNGPSTPAVHKYNNKKEKLAAKQERRAAKKVPDS